MTCDDSITRALCWLWALSVAAGDADAAEGWSGALWRSLDVDEDETGLPTAP